MSPWVATRSGLRLPPQAARTEGPPKSRPRRWINRAKRTARRGRSTEGGPASGDAAVQPARGYAGRVRRVRRRVPRRGPTTVATVGPGRDRQGCGACQRSSTRRRRVLILGSHGRRRHRARPATRQAGGPSVPRQARMGAPLRRRHCQDAGHSRLTGRHRCPGCTAWAGRASWPAGRGETSHGLWCQYPVVGRQ